MEPVSAQRPARIERPQEFTDASRAEAALCAESVESSTPKHGAMSPLEAALSRRSEAGADALEVLLRTPLQLSVRFGRARLPLREILEMGKDSVIDLDRGADGLVEIIVNGSVIATGEVVAVDGKYGVRILEIAGGVPARLDPGAQIAAMGAAIASQSYKQGEPAHE